MCYLYWLHLPTHIDIMSEGYIGVTNRLKRRLTEHKSTSENIHLQRAFIKYKNITHTILLEGGDDYCYEIEEKLRPHDKIGWNINKGGIKPPINRMIGDKNPARRLDVIEKNKAYHNRPDIKLNWNKNNPSKRPENKEKTSQRMIEYHNRPE